MTDHTPLSAAEQLDLLAWLQKGASPLGACQELGIDIRRHWLTRNQDAAYRQAIEVIYDALDQNVVSALYRAAMSGNVIAQRHWLSWRMAQCGGPEIVGPNIEDQTDAELAEWQDWEAAAVEAADAEGPAETAG